MAQSVVIDQVGNGALFLIQTRHRVANLLRPCSLVGLWHHVPLSAGTVASSGVVNAPVGAGGASIAKRSWRPETSISRCTRLEIRRSLSCLPRSSAALC